MIEEEKVRELVEKETKKIYTEIHEVKEIIKDLPVFLDRMKNYEKIEKTVEEHEMILCGIPGKKKGAIDDLEYIKSELKKYKTIFSLKIIAVLSSIFGLAAVIKTFFFP